MYPNAPVSLDRLTAAHLTGAHAGDPVVPDPPRRTSDLAPRTRAHLARGLHVLADAVAPAPTPHRRHA